MEFSVRPEVKIFYPTAIFGSLTINNQQNMKTHPDIEQAKRLIEEISGKPTLIQRKIS